MVLGQKPKPTVELMTWLFSVIFKRLYMKRQEFEDIKFESTGKKIEDELSFFERQAFDHKAV